MAPFEQLRRRMTLPRIGLLGIGVILGGLIAFPLGVIASHQFSDVPDSNIYHADIDALADAGVTTGCGDGTTYCPSAFVTREQMAAFMNRLGALGPGKVPVVNADMLDGLDSSDFVHTASVEQGSFTCPGYTMMPGSDEADWTINSDEKYFQTGSGNFYCHVLLPHGASITGVYALLYDASATLAAACHLSRYSVSDGAEGIIGSTATSGAAFAGGDVTIGDTVLSNAVVDNVGYMYVGRCTLSGASTTLRVRGLAVTYDVTGLPVW